MQTNKLCDLWSALGKALVTTLPRDGGGVAESQ